MSSLARRLDGLTDRIEHEAALDATTSRLSGLLGRLFPVGIVKDLASGTRIGHPLHPALVAVPTGAWLAAGYLDLTRDPANQRNAQRLVALGILTALPATATGASDWLETEGGEKRVGLVHAGLNYAAIGLYGASWLLRRNGRHTAGAALGGFGAGALAAAGWLGGHLAYALGVGVDTTAFQQYPDRWTDIRAASQVTEGATTLADAGGVPVLLSRVDGRLVALADRCTHRGAPLHEGQIVDGCVVCPWHDSSFSLTDGGVERGPATRPQPVLEAREVEGRVQVRRRDEARTLRVNPVGI
jgi:nitrite reductase/ring-hydroxylating ferredoxin subunit/uncharacterized membrane protein